jgi:two-component system, LytTR family, response regulator
MTSANKISAIIVDDEPLARTLVRKMIEQHDDLEIVAECESGIEAIEKIEGLAPDLVFLDVQMPEVDGFAVLEMLDPERTPYVVFVTAYDRYALKAFEVHALDYLLKPFDADRFEATLTRARRQIGGERKQDLNQRLLALVAEREPKLEYLDRVIIKDRGRVFFLKTSEIDWIEAQGNYVALHVGKEKYLFRSSLNSLEGQLDPKVFRRIHRSTVVNVDAIRELHPYFRGDYRVVLRGGEELKLSHRFRANLDKDFGGSL